MKVLVVGSVLLLASVASASYWGYVPADTPEVAAAKAAHLAAHQAAGGHLGHAAGPVDTPEVQHAKAAHFAAHAAARAGHPGAGAVGPAWHGAPAAAVHGGWYGAGAWHGPQHIPVIHNGVPVDTPEVQHAKASHLAALASAGAGAHWGGHGHGHEDDGSYKPHWDGHHYWHSLQTVLVEKHSSGGFKALNSSRKQFVFRRKIPNRNSKMKAFIAVFVLATAASALQHFPADTPEVQHAKAQHLAAHAAARSGHSIAAPAWHPAAPAWHAAAPAWHGAPAAVHGPVDTPEVQQAKAEHLAAHAAARSGHSLPVAAHAWNAAPVAAHAWNAAPVAAHDWHGAGAWHGPQHIPVIHNGVPVETPEVQHARAVHLAAHSGVVGAGHWAPSHEDDGSYKPHWDHHHY
ncbi:pupal cuticle protein-like [Toxorhynchites rutilus septentrionalis]|uniref:pupal cuticle protein-like n=1 Tax=Toxorhynchites rutilus septentrionalis TaxID=329112 RepID=UPI0024794381|nr:pupal cuticle protein-like [Toxorhynchites rutilus septentrionalis]